MTTSNLETFLDHAEGLLDAVPKPPDLSIFEIDDLAEQSIQSVMFVMQIQVLFVAWAQWLEGVGAILSHNSELVEKIDEMQGTAYTFKKTWEGRLDAGHGSQEA